MSSQVSVQQLPSSLTNNEVDLGETACFCDDGGTDTNQATEIQLTPQPKSSKDLSAKVQEVKKSATIIKLVRRSSHSHTKTEKDLSTASNNDILFKNKNRVFSKVHCSSDHKIHQEVKKLLFGSFEPLNFAVFKDTSNTPACKEPIQPKHTVFQEQLPLGLQSFGKNEILQNLLLNKAKSQNQIRITKFKRIKTLSPVNLFKEPASFQPQTGQHTRDDGGNTDRILSAHNFEFKNSTHQPKLLRPRLNSAKNEKELTKQINHKALICERMKSEPIHEYNDQLKLKRPNVVLTRRQSARPKSSMFEAKNDENIPAPQVSRKNSLNTIQKLTSNRKSEMKFDLSKIVLASKVESQTNERKLCTDISESKPSEYFFRVPKVINNQASTGQRSSKVNLSSAAKGEYQVGQSENSVYNQPANNVVSSSLPDDFDPPGKIYPRSAMSSRENATRSDSQKRQSQRDKEKRNNNKKKS